MCKVIQDLVDSLFGKGGSDEFRATMILGQPAIAKYLDKVDVDEATSDIYRNSCQNYWKNGAKVVVGPQGSGQHVTITAFGNNFLRFYVDSVAACCAMSFIHSFLCHVPLVLPQEKFDVLMAAILDQLRADYDLPKSHRYILNMVEQRGGGVNPVEVVQPVPAPMMKYPQFYHYFHKHSKKVSTMLMRNENTGNVIHHMEVIV